MISTGDLNQEILTALNSTIVNQENLLEELPGVDEVTRSLTREVDEIRKDFQVIPLKLQIVSQMKNIVGYGGFIHNFKNYVLRGKGKYQTKINKLYDKLISKIEEYKHLGVSKEEAVELQKIKNVFTKYYQGLQKVVEAYNNGTSVKKLDKIVKVNETILRLLKLLKF
ncbi:MAG: hypothetical protein ABGX26_05955 [Nautiliaceae bacterium]